REMRRAEMQVQIGDGDPLRVERDVEPARENRGGAWQQLSEPTRARRRKRVHIERAFLAHERREQPRIHTELVGLGFDGRAIGPGPDGAHDAYVARGLTG